VSIPDLVRLRRARDRMDRDYPQSLDVPAMARTALMSAGHFSRSFRADFGETPYSYLMISRPQDRSSRSSTAVWPCSGSLTEVSRVSRVPEASCRSRSSAPAASGAASSAS
jgi:hypothetical protein